MDAEEWSGRAAKTFDHIGVEYTNTMNPNNSGLQTDEVRAIGSVAAKWSLKITLFVAILLGPILGIIAYLFHEANDRGSLVHSVFVTLGLFLFVAFFAWKIFASKHGHHLFSGIIGFLFGLIPKTIGMAWSISDSLVDDFEKRFTDDLRFTIFATTLTGTLCTAQLIGTLATLGIFMKPSQVVLWTERELLGEKVVKTQASLLASGVPEESNDSSNTVGAKSNINSSSKTTGSRSSDSN